jgi:hypothetical protein
MILESGKPTRIVQPTPDEEESDRVSMKLRPECPEWLPIFRVNVRSNATLVRDVLGL